MSLDSGNGKILTSREFYAELSEMEGDETGINETITDEMARTVASWYQSTDSLGMPFASFASGTAVTVSAVLDSAIRTAGIMEWPRDLSLLIEYLEDRYRNPGIVVWCGIGHMWISGSDDKTVNCLRCGGTWQEVPYLNTSHDISYVGNDGEMANDCIGTERDASLCPDDNPDCETCLTHNPESRLECNCIQCQE